MSEFVRKGDPTGNSELVTKIAKALSKESSLGKRSIHGADVAFCSRKSVLHLAVGNIPYIMDASSSLYFAIGNAVHDTVARTLKDADILIANEFQVNFGTVRGYIDNIIVSPETGQLKIIDIKTCGRIPSRIKTGQAEQVIAYAIISGIREVSVLYVSRQVADYNGLLMKEIAIPITSASIAKYSRIMAESIVYAKAMVVVPKPDDHVTPDGCGWCPFKQNGCFGYDDGKLDLVKGFSYVTTPEAALEARVIEIQKTLIGEMNARYESTLARLDTFSGTNRRRYNEWKLSAGRV